MPFNFTYPASSLAPEGEYAIEVQVFCTTTWALFEGYTTIVLEWPVPSVTISSSVMTVEPGESFVISGELLNFSNPGFAAVQLLDSNRNPISLSDGTDSFTNGLFSFGTLIFADHYADGTYYVEVNVFSADWLTTVYAEIAIQLYRSVVDTVTVSAPDAIDVVGAFRIYGNATTSYANPRVFWEIRNSSGALMQSGNTTLSGGSYEVTGLTFASGSALGNYTINVFLRDSGNAALANATRTIQLTRSSITVSVDPLTVHGDALFWLSGNIVTAYANPRVFIEIRNSAGTLVQSSEANVSGDIFETAALSFVVANPAGRYTIIAILRNTLGAELARANNTIELTRPRPTFHGSGASVTQVTPDPVIGNATFRISGTVAHAVPGLQIRWNANIGDSSNIILSGTVPVAADGSFSISSNFSTSHPRGMYMLRLDLHDANGQRIDMFARAFERR